MFVYFSSFKRSASGSSFEYLRDSLIAPPEGFGFKQSLVDPCIFHTKVVTLIIWVLDDCLIFAKNKTKMKMDLLIENNLGIIVVPLVCSII